MNPKLETPSRVLRAIGILGLAENPKTLDPEP